MEAVLAVALLALQLAASAPAAGAVTAPLRGETDTYVTAYINVTYKDGRGEIRSERSETAKFGDGRIGAARGVLVHAYSASAPAGCAPPLLARHPGRASASASSNSTAPVPALPSEPWIALIPRGHCTFDMKVHSAALSGASAVIVFDDKEADTLDMMDISPDHNITAVLTYHWKGVMLAKLADGPSKVYVEITVANRCTRSLNSINRTSVLFVSVSFIVLMIISLAWLVFYYVQRFRYIHAKDRLSRRLCSAAKRALSKIPTRRLKIDDPELVGDGDCCAICIERYRVADVVRALPCRHEFHKSCIDPWLLDHRTCPMCKMDILKHYGFVFTGSQESILHLDIEEVAAFGLVDSPHPPRGRVQHLRDQQHQASAAPSPSLHHPQAQAQPQPHPPAAQGDEDQPACGQQQSQAAGDGGSAGAGPPDQQAEQEQGLQEDGVRGKGRGKDEGQGQGQGRDPDRGEPAARPARPASPGALSTASGTSCCSSGSSDSSASASSVTDSILPQGKRSHIVVSTFSDHTAAQ